MRQGGKRGKEAMRQGGRVFQVSLALREMGNDARRPGSVTTRLEGETRQGGTEARRQGGNREARRQGGRKARRGEARRQGGKEAGKRE